MKCIYCGQEFSPDEFNTDCKKCGYRLIPSEYQNEIYMHQEW